MGTYGTYWSPGRPQSLVISLCELPFGYRKGEHVTLGGNNHRVHMATPLPLKGAQCRPKSMLQHHTS